MHSLISGAYGQARGYNRATIRKEVAQNVRLSREQLARYAEQLIERRVQSAISTFPSYMDKVRGFRGNLPAPDEAVRPEELPIWTKEDQRSLFGGLNGPPIPGSFIHATGGSTGVPTQFYMTRESYEWRMAVADRGYSWAGAEEGRRSYYIWGVPIQNPSFGDRLKKKLASKLQRRRFFNSFLFGDDRKHECCREINRYMPEALVGYAGRLVELARFVERNPGNLSWRAKTVVTAAEGLRPGDRELLEEYLGDEVFMSYGSREFMSIGMECSQHCGYHLASDNLFAEVVDDSGRILPAGKHGRILVTDLHNKANPFVRYEIGDAGVMSQNLCPCGLPFPLLSSVDGRLEEVLLTAGGNRLTALFIPHLMKEFKWVEGYQIVQDRIDHIVVSLVSSNDLSPEMVQPIKKALHGVLGAEMHISFVRVSELEKSKSGKTPIVISSFEGAVEK